MARKEFGCSRNIIILDTVRFVNVKIKKIRDPRYIYLYIHPNDLSTLFFFLNPNKRKKIGGIKKKK